MGWADVGPSCNVGGVWFEMCGACVGDGRAFGRVRWGVGCEVGWMVGGGQGAGGVW